MNNDLKLLVAGILVGVVASMAFASSVDFSMQTMSIQKDVIYSSVGDKLEVENYYASASDYYGGAILHTSETLGNVQVVFEDGTTKNHSFEKIDEDSYLLSVNKYKESDPKMMKIYDSEGGLIEGVDLISDHAAFYYFGDGHQTYRHIYISEAGIFLGDYQTREDMPSSNGIVTLEFCHQDESKSEGYHLLARKEMTLVKWFSGNDLGFVSFEPNADFDENKDVFVLIHRDGEVLEMPLKKEAK